MADYSSLNFKKQFDDIPSDVAAIGEYGGRVKCMYSSWDSADDATNGTNYAAIVATDTMQICKIPAGARILRISEDSGLTGGFSYQKVGASGSSTLAVNDKLSEEVQVQITLAGADTDGFVFIEYILD